MYSIHNFMKSQPVKLCEWCSKNLDKLTWQSRKWTYSTRFVSSTSQNSLKNTDPKTKHSQRDKRLNAVNIQMLTEALHQQVFPEKQVSDSVPKDKLNKILGHLQSFDLWDKTTPKLPDVEFNLPALLGKNIDDHFRELALRQTGPYIGAIRDLIARGVPDRPQEWCYQSGWTRYDRDTGQATRVPHPSEEAVVFDVEVLMAEGNFPTMATAVSTGAWYSWCSPRLTDADYPQSPDPTLDDLIAMETHPGSKWQEAEWLPRVVIGHNVGFDRSFIREQYFVQGTQLRFVDTMSLHIAVSGLTSLQRVLYVASKTGSRRKEVLEHEHDLQTFGQAASTDWIKEGSLNNLSDVYQLYCQGEPLAKAKRDVFVSGNMEDVREQFQELMAYCASDVSATLDVFIKLWPQFIDRFPSPVTLAGMLEMGTAYLPINKNWQRYVDSAQTTFSDVQQEMNRLLLRLADDAVKQAEGESYKESVWLWDLDWTTRPLKYKKPPKAKKKTNADTQSEPVPVLAERQPHMPGYPKWYSELCPKKTELAEGTPLGPYKLTTQRRITPKLLQLTWDGYPLHYDAKHGWGYLVPQLYRDEASAALDQELDKQEFSELEEDEEKSTTDGKGSKKSTKTVISKDNFPQKSLLAVVAETRPEWVKLLLGHKSSQQKAEELLEQVQQSTGEENQAEIWAKYNDATGRKNKKSKRRFDLRPAVPVSQPGVGPYTDVLPGADFYKLPHKDGASKRVGNPLAKDFLSKIEEGVLRSHSGNDAEIVLKCSKMCSYWKNNMDRITSQMTVYLNRDELPLEVTSQPSYEADAVFGAILPRVVTAGTVTRRTVESTWLTASNAYTDRVGSELKSMVQAPPGYHFVGADVDSQELWIAAILGDSYSAGIHGCTAFGWMTLQGNKSDGTDLHSRTAQLVGISRDQAKVFNYGRIYGAGVRFAEQLLRQFNHRLTSQEARRKARGLYESTKGRRVEKLTSEKSDAGAEEEEEQFIYKQWDGGSESSMFNKLEQIAVSEEPQTPVLGCKISKALQPKNVAGDFMTSRVNWVVQSSAVDYLHLMLVCMRWLLQTYDISARFSISIHDEVRYLVNSEDRYRVALALQITNLLTRAMFAYKLGMQDLPQSVAFFSAVDIDTCLRKEVTMDCVTPSNPRGLAEGYNIQQGEALTMTDILEKTQGSLQVAAPPDSSDQLEDEDIQFMSRHLF